MLSKFLGIRHKHHDALSDARAAGIVIVGAIEHTGMGLSGWLAPARARRGPAPKAAADGPLKGERVALLGAARDGKLARCLAEAGARVLEVGCGTGRLVQLLAHAFPRITVVGVDSDTASIAVATDEVERGELSDRSFNDRVP